MPSECLSMYLNGVVVEGIEFSMEPTQYRLKYNKTTTERCRIPSSINIDHFCCEDALWECLLSL